MLKTTGLSNKSAFSRNNGCKSAFNRNNNSKPVSKKNNDNGEINRFDVCGNGVEHAKKLGKLSKSEKSKSEKTSKSQNLAIQEKSC